ncbi:FKBP-type peptidyl-prolyl cis-trans isomerase [Psychromonas sp. Urea-02u-13]|uniref:FKBP-type peptidyl-prolyl cis-trans isomerase n=1 Tax=Psychromonas sp. Urea-02u-13 TaxID=2058326 RepID=UPI0018E3C893|nr:FKBP-type peptidyl-prolyl cis-trans isomerase [Psychromonas sp. Urea-02u-13]
MKIVLIALLLIALFFIFQTFVANKNAPQNIQIGTDFLAGNALKEGMQTTESGLQYQVLTKGEGQVHPTANSKVTVHYHGTLIDGTVFDSSVDRNKTISFKLNQVISGWTEGVQLMVEGDKYRFYIPSNLAYGKRSAGSIPAGSMLIFDIELFDIQ